MKNFARQFMRTALLLAFTIVTSTAWSQSLLYKVSGGSMNNTVYIYWTINALPQADFFLDERVTEKLDKAQKVVLEIDLSSPTMVMEVQAAMIMQNNSIDKLLSSEDYSKIRQFFADSLLLPIDMLKQIKPLMLSSFMLPKLIGQESASYETYFLQKAMEQGKPIGGLETVAEQIGYMDKIPLDQQATMLMESINDFNESRAEFRTLVETYKSRDVEKVYAKMMETSEEYKDFGEYLIDARNRNWIPRIVELANQQITFIAVGCGHLGGEKGVLNLLREQGFTVEMLK